MRRFLKRWQGRQKNRLFTSAGSTSHCWCLFSPSLHLPFCTANWCSHSGRHVSVMFPPEWCCLIKFPLWFPALMWNIFKAVRIEADQNGLSEPGNHKMIQSVFQNKTPACIKVEWMVNGGRGAAMSTRNVTQAGRQAGRRACWIHEGQFSLQQTAVIISEGAPRDLVRGGAKLSSGDWGRFLQSCWTFCKFCRSPSAASSTGVVINLVGRSAGRSHSSALWTKCLAPYFMQTSANTSCLPLRWTPTFCTRIDKYLARFAERRK